MDHSTEAPIARPDACHVGIFRVDFASASWCITIGLCALYAALVCWKGIPALRHDWAWPGDNRAFLYAIELSTSGWNVAGIGTPNPYPGAYIVGSLIGLMGLILGSFPALCFMVCGIAAAITLGANYLAASQGASRLQIFGLEIFALFNPWVYNETVAGHLYMLLAYGAFTFLIAELLSRELRQRRIAFLLVLILPQLQFFVIALVAVAIHAVVRRAAVPLVSGLIVSFPILIGILLNRGSLLSTPYTLAWESTQSVAMMKAPVFMGYFANYASHINIIQLTALWLIVLCVLAALLIAKRRLAVICGVIISVFLMFSMGTRGPLAPLYVPFVTHVPESGLFRELYDMLGICLIGYTLILACAPARARILAIIVICAAGTCATAWLLYPPSNYWVALNDIPPLHVKAVPNTRVAFMPPFQPLQFHHKGSGADPAVHTYPIGVTPLNSYFAQYPANVALSTYALSGDTAPLRALSVSLIIDRPALQMNIDALRQQGTGIPHETTHVSKGSKALRPLPEVTLGQLPAIVSLANELGAGNAFFQDARAAASSPLAPRSWRMLPQFLPARPRNSVVNAALGWVDARMAFASWPDLGEGLGGAITTNSSALFRVTPGMHALVNVDGSLLSAHGALLSGSTGGYRWIWLPTTIHLLRCSGRCVIVGESQMPVDFPLNQPPQPYSAATFQRVTPWLVRVLIPAHSLPVLRYNVAYDPNWKAYSYGHLFAHIRLDTTVNGWLLEKNHKSYVVYIYHSAALFQAVAELIAAAWLALIAAMPVFSRVPKCFAQIKI